MLAQASSSTNPTNVMSTDMGVAKICFCPNRPRLPSRSTSLGISSPARTGMMARTIAESCVSSAACAALSLTPSLVRPRMYNPPQSAGFASELLPSDVGVSSGPFAKATVRRGCPGRVLSLRP